MLSEASFFQFAFQFTCILPQEYTKISLNTAAHNVAPISIVTVISLSNEILRNIDC